MPRENETGSFYGIGLNELIGQAQANLRTDPRLYQQRSINELINQQQAQMAQSQHGRMTIRQTAREWTWDMPSWDAFPYVQHYQVSYNINPASMQERDVREYWRTHMPALDSDVPMMALLPGKCSTELGDGVVHSRLICIENWRGAYQFVTGPLAGTVAIIDTRTAPEMADIPVWINERIKEVVDSEWQQYRNDWRMGPDGAVRLSEHDRAFAQEQARFEQAPPEERAGLLGP